MNSEEFEVVFEETIGKSRGVLIEKAREYASDGDRLHNFKQAGYLGQESPAQALGGMMRKHTISIYDMLKDGESSYSLEKWDEKILDHINYLILLRAILAEKRDDSEGTIVQTPDNGRHRAPKFNFSKVDYPKI